MRKIWFYLLVVGLFASCGNNEEKPSDGNDGNTVVSLSPEEMPKSLQADFKKFVTAFQAKDYEKLDKYVQKDGLYALYPGIGAYSEFNKYDNVSALAADEGVAEYLDFFIQSLASEQGLSGKIKFEDLSETSPCEFGEMGYWADASAGTTIVTNAYTALQENIGEEGDADEYASIQAAENVIDYKVYVGIGGEEADVLYFNEEGGKWYLSVIDLSECGL